MAKEIEKLRPATVAALTEPGMYGDGLGLYLQVGKNGGKSWIYRYQMLGGRPPRDGPR